MVCRVRLTKLLPSRIVIARKEEENEDVVFVQICNIFVIRYVILALF